MRSAMESERARICQHRKVTAQGLYVPFSTPHGPLLGPVLAVVAHGWCRMVPVSAVLDSFAAALGRLVLDIPDQQAAQERLQKLTVHRVAQLLGLTHVPAEPGPVTVLAAPELRLNVAVVCALAQSLGAQIE